MFTLEAEAGAESKKAEERLNLDDGPSLKRALDEAVIEVGARIGPCCAVVAVVLKSLLSPGTGP